MKIINISLLLLFAGVLQAQEAPLARVELSRAEKLALAYSPELKELKAQEASLEKKADARLAPGRPSVSFDAGYRRVTRVPRLSLGTRTMQFGDYYSYSAGPALNWLVWDSGSTRLNHESLSHLVFAKRAEIQAAQSSLALKTRLGYFRLKMALDQLFFIGESLKLAEAQYKDIKLRNDAGAASRMDMLSSRQELLGRKRLFAQARADLAGAAREFFAGLGEKRLALDYPADIRLKGLLPQDEPVPTVFLELESADKFSGALEAAALAGPSAAHPAVAALLETGKSYESAGRALGADRYPRFMLSAKSTLEYPNSAVLETIQQNSLGLNLSLPLFGGYKTTRDIEANSLDKLAVEAKQSGLMDDLRLEWEKGGDQLRALKTQAAINAQAVKDASELAALTYESYNAGRSTYLEVQNANLKALDAKLQSARTETQLLSQLAVMAELSEKEN